MHKFLRLIIAALIFGFSTHAISEVTPVKVGIRNFPPCVIVHDNGRVDGFEIEMWNEVARRCKFGTEYVVGSFEDIVGSDNAVSKIEAGTIDFGFSGVSTTSGRMEKYDFAHPHLSTGLKLVSSRVIKIPYKKILFILLTFVVIVVVYGHIIWFLERGCDSSIKDKYIPGIGEAMWCIMTTMSTVGYGVVAPKKLWGRIFAAFVMVTGITYFCSAATGLTISTIRQTAKYSSMHDIKNALVAVKRNSTSEKIVDKYCEIKLQTDTAEEAIDLVESGKVEAALVDAPIADYRVKKGTKVALSDSFMRQDYGILMKKGDVRREQINSALLDIITDGTYDEIYNRWF